MLNEHILNAISSTHGIVRNRYKTHCWQKQDSWCNHEECGKEMKKCLASGQQKKKKRILFLSNEVSENPNHSLVSLPEIVLV